MIPEYRVWDKADKKFNQVNDIRFYGDYGRRHFVINVQREYSNDFLTSRQATLCRYTGLKDKNKKKIFEYDIVRAKYNGSFVGIVVFFEGCFMILSKNNIDKKQAPYITIREWCDRNGKTIEIIGNTFKDKKWVEKIGNPQEMKKWLKL